MERFGGRSRVVRLRDGRERALPIHAVFGIEVAQIFGSPSDILQVQGPQRLLGQI
jgi:hypothetical protein